jgi:hypothetical protein
MKRNGTIPAEIKRKILSERAKAAAEQRRQKRRAKRDKDGFSDRLAMGFFLISLGGDS